MTSEVDQVGNSVSLIRLSTMATIRPKAVSNFSSLDSIAPPFRQLRRPPALWVEDDQVNFLGGLQWSDEFRVSRKTKVDFRLGSSRHNWLHGWPSAQLLSLARLGRQGGKGATQGPGAAMPPHGSRSSSLPHDVAAPRRQPGTARSSVLIRQAARCGTKDSRYTASLQGD